ncbi:MAG: 26S protease regulatory subunit [Solirubrobacterales bacterium]|nr:26S protease regulatory subunit [Solirubrobacterales bacterium]
MAGELPDVGAFGAAFSEFVEAMSAAARARESGLVARMREHLGANPKELPSTGADFSPTDHPNLQLALDAVLLDGRVIGISANPGFMTLGLGALLSGHAMVGPVEPGPVQYSDVEVGGGRVVRCVSSGVFLARHDGVPVVLVLSSSERPFGREALRLEGISTVEGVVSGLLSELRAAMREHNVYRGQVISLHGGEVGPGQSVRVQFHRLAQIAREAVVLPEGTIDRLERHAIGVATQAQRLRAGGRQLKRGVLLHGPPGTGKTLTVNYLLGAMPGRTTVLLTGRSLGLIEPAVAIARELTPSTVVLEDVDLVAAERTMPIGNSGILFELLNQIEGLAEDADLLFLLTTNRADLIEPALATRPGRVDLAVEIPLPDQAARARLVRLYALDVPLDDTTERELVARTDGLTGAFIKELMRQAGLRAALENRPPTSEDATAALTELLEERSTLTRRLLGQGADGADAPPPGPPPFPAMLHAFGAAGIPIPNPEQE